MRLYIGGHSAVLIAGRGDSIVTCHTKTPEPRSRERLDSREERVTARH